jgi:hypothetical protein
VKVLVEVVLEGIEEEEVLKVGGKVGELDVTELPGVNTLGGGGTAEFWDGRVVAVGNWPPCVGRGDTL